jgi:hypothetical protein
MQLKTAGLVTADSDLWLQIVDFNSW